MPALSPTMTSGNLSSWKITAGMKIQPGDVLAEIETDKAVMDMEYQEEQWLVKILVEGGTKDVKVGTVIAVAAEENYTKEFEGFVHKEEGEGKEQVKEEVKEEKKEEVEEKKEVKKETPPKQATPPPKQVTQKPKEKEVQSDRIAISPLAKAEAAKRNIDIGAVTPTGPNGRIVLEDIQNFKGEGRSTSTTSTKKEASSAKASAPVDVGDKNTYEEIPVSSMRKVIAKRLTESKQSVPHYYLTSKVNTDQIIKLRETLNTTAKGDFKLSVNDFIIKAAALACRDVPQVNSGWFGETIRQYKSVDVSVAVDTGSGLITPIITGAQNRGLASISNQVKSLAARAKIGKLNPNEYQGGTFTISNLGMFGISHFTAIINTPQSCILAVGASEKVLVPDGENATKVQNVMQVTLSCDHRVVDGAVGAQWMLKFKKYMEDPITMIV